LEPQNLRKENITRGIRKSQNIKHTILIYYYIIYNILVLYTNCLTHFILPIVIRNNYY
jgi:hypothetical protein